MPENQYEKQARRQIRDKGWSPAGQLPSGWTVILLAGIALFAFAAALYLARPFLLPVAAAFVLSVLLAPLMQGIERLGAPSGLAALLVIGGLIGAIYFTVSFVAQPAATWAANAPSYIEEASDKLQGIKEPLSSVQSISEEVKEMTDMQGGDGGEDEVVVRGPELADSLTSQMGTIAIQTVFVLALTFFLLSTRNELRMKLIAARRGSAGKLQTARMFRDVEKSVGSYIFTMTLINLGLGVAVAIAMHFMGMPRPVMWGGIAAALNFVPYIGPIITASLLAVVGLINMETLAGAAAVPAVYLGLNLIEGSFVTPLILGARLTLNPLAILLSVSFWTWLWGPVGALISLPMLVMVKTVADHTVVLAPLGMLIGGPMARPGHGVIKRKQKGRGEEPRPSGVKSV